MKTIKTIIVDDELEAREGVKLLLANVPDIDILGLCKNGIEAIDMIQGHEIDLVFLDIQMPVINGFEVINSIPKERMPHVIFVTAYDKYAIKAFEIHAVDYMLKPFTNARFAEGLARAKQLIRQQKVQKEQERIKSVANQLKQLDSAHGQIISSASSNAEDSRLLVKEKGLVTFVPLQDIYWLEAYDYYVKIHVKNQFYLIRDSLKNLESKLPSTQFIRIHKSSIINKTCIKEISTGAGSDYLVRLIDQTQLRVSRSYRDMIKTITG